jgi:GT2 family glycosyltransferase
VFATEQVIVAYLHPADHVGAAFHKSMLDLIVADSFQPRRTVVGTLDMASGANITTARNIIVRDFLRTKADWLWLIDADMKFPADTLDKLLTVADKTERPIVGGLCFRVTQVGDDLTLTPTLYGLNDMTPPRTVVYHDYPPDALAEVAATGAACLLVHRRVFETIEASGHFQKPWTWFAETLYVEYDDVISEDITFCLRARKCGFPVFVHTGIEIGHQKSIVATPALFQHTKPRIPSFVVIPGLDRHQMTADLISDLQGQGAEILLYDNGSDPAYDFDGCEVIDAKGWGLHEMWAAGIARARENAPVCDIAILNNDLRVGPDFLRLLSGGLRAREEVWISYPNVHGAALAPGQCAKTGGPGQGQSLSGYAFMIRGESDLAVDEGFGFWYGDIDLEMQARAAEKAVVTVGGCEVEHLEPTLSTRGERLEQAHVDEKLFAAKWDLDPEALFLAKNPGWGE